MEAGVRSRHPVVVVEPRPLVVGGVASVLAAGFALVRLLIAAHGDVTRFVVAGTKYVSPSTVRPHLHVFQSAGYDGQFYWRLAVAPTARSLGPVHGVRIDQSIRLTRLVYPLLAWAASLGRAGAVVWTLILVNVAALGLVAGFGALLAGDHGVNAWCGLLLAASSGLVMSISRDLCEVVMIAALVGGIVALGRHRPLLAGIAFSVAVLTHEQVALVVVAYGVHRMWTMVRDRVGPSSADVPWALPGVAFVACQLTYRSLTGSIPLLAFGGKNVTVPFADLGREVGRYLTGSIHRQSILFLPQLLVVIAAVAVAVWSRRIVAPADRWMLWALAAAVLLAVSLSDNVWIAPSELRQVVIVPTMAWLVIIVARRRPPNLLVGATAGIWLLTIGLRAVAI